jgi:hypothetical protein
MWDVLFLAATLSLFAGLGYGPCQGLLGHLRGTALAAPVLGSGVFGILVTLLYRFGIPLDLAGRIAVALALPNVVLAIVDRARDRTLLGKAVIFVGLVVVGFLALLPKWVGPPEFSVFQGNEWDHWGTVAFLVSQAQWTRERHSLQSELLSQHPRFDLQDAIGIAERWLHAEIGPYAATVVNRHA